MTDDDHIPEDFNILTNRELLDKLIVNLEHATKELEALGAETCTWSQDDWEGDAWVTGCRNDFHIIEGTPEDNRMAFCCFCGGPLRQVPYEDDIEEEDDD